MGAEPKLSARLLPTERRAAWSLATLYILRMLGLFLILPVLALHADEYTGASPFLIGVAIGIYGLTQAGLQIPFGLLSDRIGRKRIILFGLLVFAIGSVTAALADHIIGVIIGRALQGAGAIAAAVLALAADLSREEQRTKVMAIIGISIGFAFILALLLAPVLGVWIGVDGIFWLTSALALSGMLLVRYVVPDPVRSRIHRDTETIPSMLRRVLSDTQLLRLDGGIFLLHLLLTATFVVLPLTLRDQAGLAGGQHWQLYLPALLIGVGIMAPGIILAERRQMHKSLLIAAIITLGLGEYGFIIATTPIGFLIALVIFFTGVNYLEASLPSLIAKLAPIDAKGTALGIYSTSQFLGIFCGGLIAGWLHGRFGTEAVFWLAGGATLGWLGLALTMTNPHRLSNHLLNVGCLSEDQAQQLARRLLKIPGIDEAVVVATDGVAYLKIDRRVLDPDTLTTLTVTETQ